MLPRRDWLARECAAVSARKPRTAASVHPHVASTVDVYAAFCANPSPANAVALARADFQAANGGAHPDFVAALQLAEKLLRQVETLAETHTSGN